MGKINDYSLGHGWNSSSAKRVPRLILSSLPRREYYVPPAAGQGLKCARAMARLLRALLPQAWTLGQCHPLERHHTWSCLLKPQGYTASLRQSGNIVPRLSPPRPEKKLSELRIIARSPVPGHLATKVKCSCPYPGCKRPGKAASQTLRMMTMKSKSERGYLGQKGTESFTQAFI